MTRTRSVFRILLTALILSLFFIPAYAEDGVSWSDDTMPVTCDNTSVRLLSRASLTPVSDGYMRVFFDGEKIGIEYYDDSMNLTRSGTLEPELPVWGGFYAGSDGYYIAEGQYNTDENDSTEVIRIIRYDRDWNRTGAASITSNPSLFGGEVRYPFDYASNTMTEYGGKLYLATAHEGYVDEAVGQGHQGMLLIEVDKSTMTGEIVKSDLWHSFAQYVKAGQDGLYLLEQSEGSRYTKLSKYVPETKSTPASFSVLDYGGTRTSAWAIPCRASVDGLELSQTHALSVGTSIDQTNYDNYTSDTPYNIYLAVTPFDSFSTEGTTLKWLTSYTDGGKSFFGVHITKVNDDRFMISWEERPDETQPLTDPLDTLSTGRLKYLFIDGAGNQVSQIFTADAPITDCAPVLKDGNIFYYASNANMFNIYMINPDTGAFSKKTLRVAGRNATWNIEDGVLIISGTGPIAGNPSSSSYSFSAAWKHLRDDVTKISIAGGITSIPDNAFNGFSSLEEVDIANGLVSIGKEAFYSCNSLMSIYIPDSVTSIGEDFLWTGYYWTYDGSHVTRATVYGNCGSYAIGYARDNSIKYKSPHDFEDDFTVDKEPTCTETGTKSRHCRICGDKTDITTIPANGHDYELGEVSDGSAEATCRVCGDHSTVNVPVSFSVFWRNETSDSGYYYPNPGILKQDEKMYVMISSWFTGDENRLDEFIVDTGNEQIRANRLTAFSFSEPGIYPVKIYSRYLPELCETYEMKVADESGSVPGAENNGDDPGQSTDGDNPGQTSDADNPGQSTDGDIPGQSSGNQQDGQASSSPVPGETDSAASDPTQEGSTSTGNTSSEGSASADDTSQGADPAKQYGEGNSPVGKGASVEAAETAIAGMKTDNDLPGAVFGKLQLKSSKQTNTSVTVLWKKISGAKYYVIYGNKCGKTNKMKRLARSTGKSKKFSKVLGKEVKKGTYYKFMVIAYDKNDNVVSSSKIIHVATKGGKVGNIGKITTKAKNNKVSIKKGKTFKLKGKQIAASKKLKVKTHRKLSYESSNTRIATVSKSGVIKGRKKGSCKIYVYAQNGICKTIKVTIK